MGELKNLKNKMVKKIIAVDLGGTNLRAAVVKDNKILKYRKEDTPKTKDKLVKRLFNCILDLVDGNIREIKAIGVSCAGPLKNGIIKNPPNLPLKNFNLKKVLEGKFKKRVEVENDANCAALAEYKLGHGKGKKNLVLLTLGTGIGGGVIINNELYTGTGYASEPGHMIIDKNKSFEQLAASRNQKKLTKKAFGKELMVRDLLEIKDKKSDKILDELSEYLGKGIGSLINIFDPDIVVLSGGIRETGNRFLNKIKSKSEKYSILPKKTPLLWSKLDHPGILGAALLVSEKKR